MTVTIARLDGADSLDVLDTAQTISDETFDAFSSSLLGESPRWTVVAGARVRVAADQSFFQHFPGTDMFRWESSEAHGIEPTQRVDFSVDRAVSALDAFLQQHLPTSVDRSTWMREAPTMELTHVAWDLTRDSAPSFQSTMAHILYPQTLDDGSFVAGARLVATLVPGADGGGPRVVRCFRYARVPLSSPNRAEMRVMRASARTGLHVLERARGASPRGRRDDPATIKREIRAALRAVIPKDRTRIRVTTVRTAYYSAPPFVPQAKLLPVWVVRGTMLDESSGERSLLHRLVIPARALAQVNHVELRRYTGLAFANP